MTAYSLPLSQHDIESLERATLDAVAPPAVEELDGWLLPFDRSTIGRAISAVPLRHDAGPVVVVQAMQARYAAHDLRAAFRVCLLYTSDAADE